MCLDSAVQCGKVECCNIAICCGLLRCASGILSGRGAIKLRVILKHSFGDIVALTLAYYPKCILE